MPDNLSIVVNGIGIVIAANIRAIRRMGQDSRRSIDPFHRAAQRIAFAVGMAFTSHNHSVGIDAVCPAATVLVFRTQRSQVGHCAVLPHKGVRLSIACARFANNLRGRVKVVWNDRGLPVGRQSQINGNLAEPQITETTVVVHRLSLTVERIRVTARVGIAIQIVHRVRSQIAAAATHLHARGKFRIAFAVTHIQRGNKFTADCRRVDGCRK